MILTSAPGRVPNFPHESLQATLLASLLSVWVLVGLFYYLNRYTKRSYFTLWTVGWLFYALWLTSALGLGTAAGSGLFGALRQWCIGAAAAFLFWGTLGFVGARARPNLMALFIIFLLAWSIAGFLQFGQGRLFEFPFFGLVGLVGLAISWSFYRYRRRQGYVGAGLLIFGFALWALHTAAYPFWSGADETEISGLLIATALQLFIAVSMIILVLEEVRETSRNAIEQVSTIKKEKAALLTRVSSTEERYRSLFDQASEAILIADAEDLRILELNKTAEQLLGVSREEAGKRPLPSFFHVSAGSGDLPRTGREWFEWISARRQLTLVKRNGSLNQAEVDAAPVEFEGREAFQFFIREVTDRLRLEQQLRQSEKLAALGRMISGVAHELNNPLTVIKGYLDLVIAHHPLSDGTKSDLEKVSHECDRAANLVKNFLDFARDVPTRREPVRINDLIQRLAELRKIELLLAGLDLDLELDPRLPLAMADPDQLHQVLVNLVTNAIQALVERENGPRGKVRVTAAFVGGLIRISVEDNGPGVPPELENRIFEPFFTTKAVGTGTGLGLSIAHRILTDHGGRVYYHASPLGGAGFYLEIPAGTEGAAAAPARKRDEARQAARQAGAGARILVLDDEKHIAELLSEMLRLLGHDPTPCLSPVQALKVLEGGGYDLILSDFRMPVMNGQEFYERVREKDPKLASRIIFLTGDMVSEETHGFLKGSGNSHLAKPFQLPALQLLIDQVIAKAREPAVV
jgi:PAS domain S-box-containing protein